MTQSHTMAAIDREVTKLPPFPLSAPMPEISTGRYLDKPCSRPQARYMPKGVCWCGYLMGEHDA